MKDVRSSRAHDVKEKLQRLPSNWLGETRCVRGEADHSRYGEPQRQGEDF
jgi:hypothetical protein